MTIRIPRTLTQSIQEIIWYTRKRLKTVCRICEFSVDIKYIKALSYVINYALTTTCYCIL